jgi:hypothetical protein
MAARATKGYVRQHGLTTEQQAALDLLVTGKTDQETAEAVGVNRVTVTKWRNYGAYFQAALNQRRREIFGVAVDRLRTLLPLTLDVLKTELRDPANTSRGQLALSILKVAGMAVGDIGPTDAEAVIEKAALARSGNQEAMRWGAAPPLERETLIRVWEDALGADEDHSWESTCCPRPTRVSGAGVPDLVAKCCCKDTATFWQRARGEDLRLTARITVRGPKPAV